MKQITYEDLKLRKFDKFKISNYKLIGICCRCNKEFEYSAVKNFLQSRLNNTKQKHNWQTCSKCWLKINTVENPKWIEKNRQAQLIAQNKPEQKKKNAQGVSKSWNKTRREKASKLLKEKWKEKEFANKALKNLQWTQTNNQKFYKILKKSIGSGGLKGYYHNIYYDSALELSYLFWCFDNHIKVKRYNLDPIEYVFNNKKKLYFPDFIENDCTIVEIKGLGLYYHKNYYQNIAKIEAAKNYFDSYKVLFANDLILKTNYKKARNWHHENS